MYSMYKMGALSTFSIAIGILIAYADHVDDMSERQMTSTNVYDRNLDKLYDVGDVILNDVMHEVAIDDLQGDFQLVRSISRWGSDRRCPPNISFSASGPFLNARDVQLGGVPCNGTAIKFVDGKNFSTDVNATRSMLGADARSTNGGNPGARELLLALQDRKRNFLYAYTHVPANETDQGLQCLTDVPRATSYTFKIGTGYVLFNTSRSLRLPFAIFGANNRILYVTSLGFTCVYNTIEEPEPSPTEESGGPACFPADANVQVMQATENSSVYTTFTKQVDTLQPGEHVADATQSYTQVYGFSHRDANTLHTFNCMITHSLRSLCASPGHYIPINEQRTLSIAADIRVGDTLHTLNGTQERVIRIYCKTKRGLYNPHTLSDAIAINGFVVSTFTKAVHPPVAKALLQLPKWVYLFTRVPFRIAYGMPVWLQSTSLL